MMAERTERPKARKTLERLRLAESIERLGYEVLPCSFCATKGVSCKMLEKSSRCAECARRGRACDAAGLATTLGQINAEFDRLDREEEAVEEQMAEVQTKLRETISKLAKLRRQKKILKTKGVEMVQRGLQTMDELELEDMASSPPTPEQHNQHLQGVQHCQQQQQIPIAQVASSAESFYLDWNAVGLPDQFPTGTSSAEASKSPFSYGQ